MPFVGVKYLHICMELSA